MPFNIEIITTTRASRRIVPLKDRNMVSFLKRFLSFFHILAEINFSWVRSATIRTGYLP